MNFEPEYASASEIASAVKTGIVSAREVAKKTLDRINSLNTSLNAFTSITAERALAEANRIDRKIAANQDPGPLAGVPFAVKNLFDIEGEVTLAGSKINQDDQPATQDATAVARLVENGALCMGGLNMGEYAYDFITDNPHYGSTRNPHDLSRSAGGSSGGSGSAVAAGMVAIALGSDTNGSIRVPSSFCGIWGLRPTYGTLSRGGSFAFVDSLDTIGPFTRNPEDLALCYDALSGPDLRDKACSLESPSPLLEKKDQGIHDLKIARLGGYFETGGEDSIHSAVDDVSNIIGTDKTVTLPEPELARISAYLITAAESALRHRDRLKNRAEDFDPVIRDRLLSGNLIPAAWPIQAQRFRTWWKDQLARIFENTDILIAPATPCAAPLLGQETMEFNGETIPLRPNIGLFTQPVSLIGLPVLAAPIRTKGQLPCAVQIIGAPHSEAKLLQVARHLERSGLCAAPTVDPCAELAPYIP